jgi:hypothetical protein
VRHARACLPYVSCVQVGGSKRFTSRISVLTEFLSNEFILKSNKINLITLKSKLRGLPVGGRGRGAQDTAADDFHRAEQAEDDMRGDEGQHGVDSTPGAHRA